MADRFEFSQSDIDEIIRLKNINNFPAAYRYAAEKAMNGVGVDKASILWLLASAQVNEGSGFYSEFIRGYTKQQYEIRYGNSADVDSIVQKASNEIAGGVLAEIIADKMIPSINVIAEKDAAPVAAGLFNGDPGGWAGNPLFLALGVSGPLEANVLEKPGDTYDALAMLKSARDNGSFFDKFIQSITVLYGSAIGSGYSLQTALVGGSSLNSFLQTAYGGAISAGDVYFTNIELDKIDRDGLVEGSEDNDYMHGGVGNDTLLSSASSDIMDGGDGDDTADFSDSASALVVTVKRVTSTAQFVAGVSGDGSDSLYSIEKIIGSNNDDTFAIQSLPDGFRKLTLNGGGGIDQITGVYLENITIDAINETISFDTNESDGFDSIVFKNIENFQGSNGNDLFLLSGKEQKIDGKNGFDIVDFTLAAEKPGELELIAVEKIIGSSFDDVLSLERSSDAALILGKDGSDVLTGGTGDDTIFGGIGDDLIDAGAGNDFILGGEGDDNILGGAGNDLIMGSSGADIIYGGAGADVFVIKLGSHVTIGGADADDKIAFIKDASAFEQYESAENIQGMLSEQVFIASTGVEWDSWRSSIINDLYDSGQSPYSGSSWVYQSSKYVRNESEERWDPTKPFDPTDMAFIFDQQGSDLNIFAIQPSMGFEIFAAVTIKNWSAGIGGISKFGDGAPETEADFYQRSSDAIDQSGSLYGPNSLSTFWSA